MSIRLVPVMAVLGLALASCGGGGGTAQPPSTAPAPAPPPPTPTPGAFAAVDAAAASAFQSQGIPGMGLAIYDRDGRKVFERMYGDFAPDRRVAVASASKLVSGLVILRLVDQGFLSLDSTTAAVLGWTGPQGAITLRQLLSFTSGLPPVATCTSRAAITLAECAAELSTVALLAAPGTRFDYGNSHLQVAARMAEVVTGSTWNAIVAQQLGNPLALSPQFMLYTAPRQAVGVTNPLVAGGLRATMDEYGKVLELAFRSGQYGGAQLINGSLMAEQSRSPYPNAVIGNTPLPSARYGLAAWLECATPATGCAVLSSPGAFGFTPWLDRDVGYYAILGMEIDSGNADGVVTFSVQLSLQLRPLIATALGR